jgi:hypothetical protein
MYAKGGTTIAYSTSSDSQYETIGETTNEGYYVISVTDDGWHEATVDDIATIEIKEPAQEQDEPDTGERLVYWERPHRRLATVTASRDRPRQLESTFG